MVGIKSYGAYIPWYRIDRKVIYGAMGWLNPAGLLPGEKAVASYDEDSITMAVNAGTDCLKGVDRNTVDGVYFASVSLPYKLRQNAAIIATALDLRPNIRTADFTSSTKAGTTALVAARDAIKAGSAKKILVCASDCRAARAGSSQEQAYGDAAAAILVGEDDVIAELQEVHSLSYDFADRWMADFDRFDRISEDRWIRDEAYTKFVPEVILGLANKSSLSPKDVGKLVLPSLYAREDAGIGKRLGLEPGQIQHHLLDAVGNCGTAHPLVLLAVALEDSNPKDNIVVTSWGSGCDALLFQATEKMGELRDKKKGVKKALASKNMLTNYTKYTSFRNVGSVDLGMRAETGVPWDQKPLSWRNRKSILGLVGSKCKKCGTPQYPAQRVCVNPSCKAIDQMEEYRFSDKKGQIFTYTEDHLGFTLNPPALYGMIDFEGGGRFNFEVTDCEPGSLKVGMPVEMSFRRKFVDVKRGTYFYFWKVTPAKE
jgi:hydroxymethylglutaryl-CoA synthase